MEPAPPNRGVGGGEGEVNIADACSTQGTSGTAAHSLPSSSISSFFWQPDEGSAMLSCTHRERFIGQSCHARCCGGGPCRRSTVCADVSQSDEHREHGHAEAGSNGRRTRLHAGQRLQPSATACCRRCSAKEVAPVQQARKSRHRGRQWISTNRCPR